MFEKGDYVVCGSNGVCTVEDVTTLSMPGVDKDREYYILKPVYTVGSTVYIPVDADERTVRKVLSREEADRLIREIPGIPLINDSNDKFLEQEYKGCMRTNQCAEWVRILKTAHLRKLKRQEMGRKITAVDAKYSRIAEDILFGELAVSLEISREQVGDFLASRLGQK